MEEKYIEVVAEGFGHYQVDIVNWRHRGRQDDGSWSVWSKLEEPTYDWIVKSTSTNRNKVIHGNS